MFIDEDGTIYAELTCPICGRMYSQDVMTESMAHALEDHPQVCPAAECQENQRRKNEAAELEAEAREEQNRRLDDARRRLDESGLLRYELGFDADHASANRKLWSWMYMHLDFSVWIYGQTGRCKTRVIQDAAREAVKSRSVRYWPVYDLAARLTETSKRPEAQLFDIYDADLLILDDLGAANMTAARLTALTAIVDRRYIGWDQVRRRQHSDTAQFNLFSLIRRRGLGGQLWITSQVPPDDLIAELAAINATDAAALVRRLADMCVIHEAEAVR